MDSTSTLRRWGFYAAMAFIFVRFSMIGEFFQYGLGFRPYLVMLLGPIVVLLLVMSGSLPRTLRERPAFFFVAFMAWLLICSPFSVWKGGTFTVLKQAFTTEYSMYFIIAGLVMTVEELRKLAMVITLALSVDMVVLALVGETESGRLSMGFGTLLNPNDLANHIVTTLPFVLVTYHLSPRFSLGHILAVPTILGSLCAVLLTGSRMGMLALGLTGLFLFVRATMKQRVIIAVAAVPAMLVLFLLLPKVTLQRYLTVFTENQTARTAEDLEELQTAQRSSEARLHLLTASLQQTLENPLFGVGPGQFAVVDADKAKEEGRAALWEVTHNTYTEVSSEAGIPALIFYCGALLSGFLLANEVVRRARRYPDQKDVAVFAFYLTLSILGFAACSFFGSMAYRFYMPSLIGMAVVLLRAAKREFALKRTAAAAELETAGAFPVPLAPLPVLSPAPSRPLPARGGAGFVWPKATRSSGTKRVSPLRH